MKLPAHIKREPRAGEAVSICQVSGAGMALVGVGGEVLAEDQVGHVLALWWLSHGGRMPEWGDSVLSRTGP